MDSRLTVNYNIRHKAIQQLFNDNLHEFLEESIAFEALGFDVNLFKANNASLQLSGQEVMTKIPLRIILKRNALLSQIKVNGILEVTFLTKLNIDESGKLSPETTLEDYDWINPPKLSLGQINFGVKSLANSIIEKSRDKLLSNIDLAIEKQLNHKQQFYNYLIEAQKIKLINNELSLWLNLDISEINIAPFRNNNNFLTGNISTSGSIGFENQSDLKSGLANPSLPIIKWKDNIDENSKIRLNVSFNFNRLSSFCNQQFGNKNYNLGGKKLEFENIKISSSQSFIKIEADLKGDIKGQFLFEGRPNFNKDKQIFKFDDLDINIKTKNILQKAVIWAFKGKMKNDLSKALNFTIHDKISILQNLIDIETQKRLKPLKINLQCLINDIIFYDIAISNDDVSIDLVLRLYIEMTINKLDQIPLV
ncbi:MAG: DUF4403 family protein [Saprospiraceae bacterium]|nr:DUF4403 family protein [Saprospiraceae bacterium]NNL92685.1 DUF4403 family protein [Saprospiraceae bacterium]